MLQRYFAGRRGRGLRVSGQQDHLRPPACMAESLEQRLLMAAALSRGGSGYSGTLSTDPVLRKQQLACDPDEPFQGSTSVAYDATQVTLRDVIAGPGYGQMQGFVEVMVAGTGTILQPLSTFLSQPAGVETGYVQISYQLVGAPGQIIPPAGFNIEDENGVDGVDTHALFFDLRPNVPTDAPLVYQVFAATKDSHSGNDEDFLIVNDAAHEQLGPDDLAPTTVVTQSARGSIGGTVFEDVDSDGTRDATDPPLEGVTVFLDLDGDGNPADNEPTDLTDANGAYLFANLRPGPYDVRRIAPAGFVNATTTPPGGLHHVTLPIAGQVTNRDFGNVHLTADIVDVSPDPRLTSVGSIPINFNEPVTGFNLADLQLTRDGAVVSLAAATLSPASGAAYTLSGLSALTTTPGNYQLTLVAAGSGITNAAGVALAANASDAWRVQSIPVVTPPAPQTATEGVSKSFPLGSFTDGGGAADGPWSVSVNWGDGSPAETFTAGPNLLSAPDALDNAAWIKVQSSVVPNAAAAPDGSLTADKLVANANNVQHFALQQVSKPAASQRYRLTLFLKPAGHNAAAVYLTDGGVGSLSGALAQFNLTGAGSASRAAFGSGFTAESATIVPDVNGWYKVTLIAQTNAANLLRAYVFTNGNGAYVGNGVDGVLVAGVKVYLEPPISLGVRSHTYGDHANYTVNVTVTDQDGLAGSASFGVAVANGAPVVASPGNQSAFEGVAKNFNLGSFTDGETGGGLWSVSVNWGDGSPAETFTAGPNLLSAPDALDNAAWIKVQSSVVPNAAAAPDGSLTADKLVANANNVQHFALQQVSKPAASQRYRLTLFLKPAGHNAAAVYLTDGGVGSLSGALAQFNLTGAGSASRAAFGSGFTAESATIVPDVNGWYKVTLIAQTNAANLLRAYVFTNGNGAYVGNGVDGVLVAGVRVTPAAGPALVNLPTRPHAYAAEGNYTVNVTVTDQDGAAGATSFNAAVVNGPPTVSPPVDQSATAGVSRSFDLGSFNDPGGLGDGPWNVSVNWGDGSPATTFQVGQNILTASSALDDAAWIKFRSSVSPNATTAPDGSLTADKLIASTDSSQHFAYQQVSKPAASQKYAVSFFLKPAGYSSATLYLTDGGVGSLNGAIGQFGLTGAGSASRAAFGSGFTAQSATITPDVNGWYKVSLVALTNAAAALRVYLFPNNNGVFAGDGTSGVFVSSVQVVPLNPIALGTRPHTYASSGAFNVQVTVTDNAGAAGSAAFHANVAPPPPLRIDTASSSSVRTPFAPNRQGVDATIWVGSTAGDLFSTRRIRVEELLEAAAE